MSNEFGYIPESPAQSFGNNKGIFTPTDIYDLTRAGKFTQYGQLELIQTQTVSGVSVVDFTSIEQTTYKVHFLTINDLDLSNDQENINVRFSNDSGSSFESSNYHFGHKRILSSGTELSLGSSGQSQIEVTRLVGNATNETQNGYIYFYNLGQSNSYSFTSSQLSGMYYTFTLYTNYGGGSYTTSEIINAIRIKDSGSGGTFTGTFSLYGIKEYE